MKRLLLVLAATPLLVACSAGSIPESEVESDTKAQLDGAEKVDCPGDLDAETGTTMSCTATVKGKERTLKLTVTKVEDDTAIYTVDYDE